MGCEGKSFALTLTLTTETPINRAFQPKSEGMRVKKEKKVFFKLTSRRVDKEICLFREVDKIRVDKESYLYLELRNSVRRPKGKPIKNYSRFAAMQKIRFSSHII